MNELTDKIWRDMEARLVDIKGALADHRQRYVFGVPKSRIASLRGRFPKFDPENLFEQVVNEDRAEISEYVFHDLKMSYKIEFRGAGCWFPKPRPEPDYTTGGGILIWNQKPSFPMALRRAIHSQARHGIEERLIDIKDASADQTEDRQRYVFGVPESRIESLRERLPKFTPENLFKQVLDEDEAEICEYLFHGLMTSYKIEFPGARCRLRSPRPEADYATRRGILIWSEKPSFPMDLRHRSMDLRHR
jgi:hypothetical protein